MLLLAMGYLFSDDLSYSPQHLVVTPAIARILGNSSGYAPETPFSGTDNKLESLLGPSRAG